MAHSTVEETLAPASPPPPGSPALSPRELARWAWRQLTSMRTALVLLLLLALAAVPGSVVPQADISPVEVGRWQDRHPTLAPVYEKLGLFSVYDSPWFSAVYILLMVSLVGCIVPRTRVYWRALRAAPPAAPRNLGRLPSYASFETDAPPEEMLDRARLVLRRRRFRVVGGDGSVSAERGRLREGGNLLFHLSVLVVLVGFAAGQLLGYKGGVIVPVGQGFANALTQYDEFAPGSLFDPADLAPVSLEVDDFTVDWVESGPNMGQPTSFVAEVTYRESPDAAPKAYDLRVNHPLELDGASVFLVGHGYAPLVTVRDGNGDVAYQGPAVFLPQDPSFASFGVIKVPDAKPSQLAFDGYFLPTYGFTMERGPYSQYPDWLDPRLTLLGYYGDLGMDDGRPESVYEIEQDRMRTIQRPGAKKGDPLGTDFRITLAPGQGVKLPGGLGTIEFNGVQRWVKLQVSHTPGRGIALAGVVLALLGLMGSLFVRPRRAWVRVGRGEDGRTLVEVAGLDRSSSGEGLDDEVAEIAKRMQEKA